MLPGWAIVTPARRQHIERVAELAGRWASEMGISETERRRWLQAVWLHDALRDAPAEELKRWAPDAPGPGDLRHGPASAARAKAEGESDRGVLDAVRYHSIGLAEWDMVGRILYCADFLEPGRKHARKWRADLAHRLPSETTQVVREVATARVGHLVTSGRPLLEPTVRFWNSLVADSSGSA
ncbi:MAG TPA: HD domain-containing protein [Gemmatimonadales bacterium]|nr:HD domain-containing protein [Gemmatimonadales bacterium]